MSAFERVLEFFEMLLDRAIFGPPMERALFNVFLLIFFLTALVTLAGIANLLSIDPSFLTKLYFALIAEVAGGVTTLFGITFLGTRRQSKNKALDDAVPGEERSVEERFSSLLKNRSELSNRQQRILGLIQLEITSARTRISEQEISKIIKEKEKSRASNAEVRYRLEHLRWLRFLEKETIVGGTRVYRLSDEYQNYLESARSPRS